MPGEDSDCDDPGHDDCFDGGSRSQAGSGAKNRDPGSPPSTWARGHKVIHLELRGIQEYICKF